MALGAAGIATILWPLTSEGPFPVASVTASLVAVAILWIRSEPRPGPAAWVAGAGLCLASLEMCRQSQLWGDRFHADHLERPPPPRFEEGDAALPFRPQGPVFPIPEILRGPLGYFWAEERPPGRGLPTMNYLVPAAEWRLDECGRWDVAARLREEARRARIRFPSAIARASGFLDATRLLKEAPDLSFLAIVDAEEGPLHRRGPGTCAVRSYGFHHLELAADCEAEAWLLYAHGFHPFWKATVDGAEIPSCARISAGCCCGSRRGGPSCVRVQADAAADSYHACWMLGVAACVLFLREELTRRVKKV